MYKDKSYLESLSHDSGDESSPWEDCINNYEIWRHLDVYMTYNKYEIWRHPDVNQVYLSQHNYPMYEDTNNSHTIFLMNFGGQQKIIFSE